MNQQDKLTGEILPCDIQRWREHIAGLGDNATGIHLFVLLCLKEIERLQTELEQECKPRLLKAVDLAERWKARADELEAAALKVFCAKNEDDAEEMLRKLLDLVAPVELETEVQP